MGSFHCPVLVLCLESLSIQQFVSFTYNRSYILKIMEMRWTMIHD
jgi:hypothetical protein